ncbi:helix-turn-helix transcriptional regulator [Luteococcus sp.]|uniref:helix-turn-helix transcriptional regulator n=1 Tax=Luteococcus sp. TaxID=1969402 RepID=UPI0037357896
MSPVQPEPDMTRVREVFVTAKAESGLTYDQLVAATGLARQTLVNIAAGRYRGDLRTWLVLSKVFGSTLDDLMAPVWVHDPALPS